MLFRSVRAMRRTSSSCRPSCSTDPPSPRPPCRPFPRWPPCSFSRPLVGLWTLLPAVKHLHLCGQWLIRGPPRTRVLPRQQRQTATMQVTSSTSTSSTSTTLSAQGQHCPHLKFQAPSIFIHPTPPTASVMAAVATAKRSRHIDPRNQSSSRPCRRSCSRP